MLYELSEKYLKENILNFICCYDAYEHEKMNYCPETFTVNDKFENRNLIFFDDVPYDVWIQEMICSTLEKIRLEKNHIRTYKCVRNNLDFLLNYQYNGKKLREQIYNQEFIDIINRVIAYTLYGDVNAIIDTAKIFNELADRIMPLVIENIKKETENLQKKEEFLLKLSIASGLSGLDLKGAPAAASKHSNTGIMMKQYLHCSLKFAANDYQKRLFTVLEQCTYPVFDFEEFEQNLYSAKQIVWFTDDYIETYFDFLLIEELLKKYNVNITIIPKNSVCGNDMNWLALEKILQCEVFKELEEERKKGRLIIDKMGPKMGTLNLNKLSKENKNIIEKSDFCVLKGCRIFELTQGFIGKKSFFAFIVSRYLSEVTSGFDASEYPVIFLSLNPYEYGYFGINKNNSQKNIFLNGRREKCAMTTVKEHVANRNLMDPEELICAFEALKNRLENYEGEKKALYKEMDLIAEKLVLLTKQTYDQVCTSYQEIRLDEPHELDKKMWNLLSYYIEKNIHNKSVDILDVGTGSGRDIMYATKLGYNAIGIDNADGFIDILSRLEAKGNIPKNSYKKCDMRDLDFPDKSFDVVRQNASVLHLPLIAPGYMADKAISESHRVLRDNGLIYIFVKAGEGLKFVDTNEGLGGRVFQFYSLKMVRNLVERNGFCILDSREVIEKRKNGEVKWFAVIAQKI